MENKSSQKRCKTRKRKTKKCLDELRNKAKMTNVGSNDKFNKHCIGYNGIQKILKLSNTNETSKSNINITKERLTMKHGLFAKGVRSETISRPSLSEECLARMDGNLHKIIDLANGKPTHSNYGTKHRDLNTWTIKEKENFQHYRDKGAGPSQESLNPSVAILPTVNKSDSDTTLVFSPKECNSIDKKNDIITDVFFKKKSMNFEHFDNVHADHFEIYKEFNNSIPHFFNKHWSSLISVDIENRTKYELRDIGKQAIDREYDLLNIESRHDISRSSLSSTSMNNDPIEDIMEHSVLLNPIEYLRKIQKLNNPQHSDNIPCQTTEITTNNTNQLSIPFNGSVVHPVTQRFSENNLHSAFAINGSNYRQSTIISQSKLFDSNFAGSGDFKHNIEDSDLICNSSDDVSTSASSINLDGNDMDLKLGEGCLLDNILDESPEQIFYPRKMNFDF